MTPTLSQPPDAPPGTATALGPGPQRFTTVVARTEQELTAHVPAWADLARHALEPNVFYEPWFLREAGVAQARKLRNALRGRRPTAASEADAAGTAEGPSAGATSAGRAV
jgi:hypothetical protein